MLKQVNKIKENQGITLVALVITIIILIILSTAAISAIFLENGLIYNAQKGKKEQEKAEARERLSIVLADAYLEKMMTTEYTEEEFLEKHLEEFVYGREPNAEIFKEDGVDYISLNGYIFELDRSVPELGDYDGEEGNRPPKIRDIGVTNKTLSEISVEVTSARADGATYKYSIKKLAEEDTAYEEKESNGGNTYTYTGLTSPEKYTIKVELEVDGEVIDTKTQDVILGELEKGAIEFTDIKWNSGTASVTVSTTTSYQLQYQLVTGEGKIESNSWKTISNGGKISNIPINSTVYARLLEGTNASEYAEMKVEDKVNPIINEIKEVEKTETTIKVQVNAVDNESGIAKIEYSKDDGKTYVTDTNVAATEYTFTELSELTEYTIKVRITDGAGNIVEESKKITTAGEKFSEIYTETKQYTDSEGNTAWIPGGFAVGVTDNINKISKGLVITDKIDKNNKSVGNEFVWIPVGKYKTTSENKINNLSRRKWADMNVVQNPTEVSGDSVINLYYYGEGDSRSIAKDTIKTFKTQAEAKGGFYIGRYEAGTDIERTSKEQALTIPLVQKNKYPYVNVTRDQANTQSKAMYSGNSYVVSELISSYAWDTALNFICQTNKEGYTLATTTDINYGNFGGGRGKINTGEYTADNYSNIHDILGNRYEWTTEYCDKGLSTCVNRGGAYNTMNAFAADHYETSKSFNFTSISFRIQLYVK